MKTISLLDTTIANYNLGNQIIMDSINNIINELFPEDFLFRLQYGEKFGKLSLKYIKQSNYVFFGGTNSLTSEMNKYKQMGFRLLDLFYIKNKITLLGTGWWQYQKNPNLYTRFFLKNMLSKETLHSVRDSYTKKMLSRIGINNVINTSCPTVWNLTKEYCKSIPVKKSENVLTTLTDYNRAKLLDEKLFSILLNNYNKVYFWTQGVGDLKYLYSLNIPYKDKLIIINPRLSAYDNVLKDEDLDYIGTRLHAGIRAIQYKKRTLIIAIDNRAKEIAKDINLNFCEREKLDDIINFISCEYQTSLNIPIENIKRWKGQFL